MTTAAAPVTPRLMRRRAPAVEPVTSASLLLFRLGELCNNRCPMCSNSGDPALWQIAGDELLRRARAVIGAGFRRVIVTGGEPTIHPAFWQVVETFAAAGVRWDINTQGRSFATADFATRAVATGLDRAIVSLHSHIPAVSAEISGGNEQGHAQTVAGIDALAQAGARLLLNAVLTRPSLEHVAGWVEACADRWGDDVALKVCFPSRGGRGGGWAGIDLRYRDVQPALVAARRAADARGLTLHWEAIPHCVHGEWHAVDVSRSGFGESHYLDDHSGDRVYAIRTIEAELRAFAPQCRGCAALARCAGAELAYLRAYGAEELRPRAAGTDSDDASGDGPSRDDASGDRSARADAALEPLQLGAGEAADPHRHGDGEG